MTRAEWRQSKESHFSSRRKVPKLTTFKNRFSTKNQNTEDRPEAWERKKLAKADVKLEEKNDACVRKFAIVNKIVAVASLAFNTDSIPSTLLPISANNREKRSVVA